MTGKEKSRRRGWPRHAVSFPPAKTPQSREGEADIGRRGAWLGLFHSTRKRPRTAGRVEPGLGLGSYPHPPRSPARNPAKVGPAGSAAGPRSSRALEEAAGNDTDPGALGWGLRWGWVGADVQAGGEEEAPP